MDTDTPFSGSDADRQHEAFVAYVQAAVEDALTSDLAAGRAVDQARERLRALGLPDGAIAKAVYLTVAEVAAYVHPVQR